MSLEVSRSLVRGATVLSRTVNVRTVLNERKQRLESRANFDGGHRSESHVIRWRAAARSGCLSSWAGGTTAW